MFTPYIKLTEAEYKIVEHASEYELYSMNGGKQSIQEYYEWDSSQLRDYQIALAELTNRTSVAAGHPEDTVQIPKVLN